MAKILDRFVKEQILGHTLPLETHGMFRYRAALPIPYEGINVTPGVDIPALVVGNTPLTPAPSEAERLGLKELWIKDDGRNPTGSLKGSHFTFICFHCRKDRASGLVVTKAKLEKREIVSTASTGNAAAALAGMCASAKQKCVIFVPHTAPEAKQTQLVHLFFRLFQHSQVMYGANSNSCFRNLRRCL